MAFKKKLITLYALERNGENRMIKRMTSGQGCDSDLNS